jgi:hypothetical protein
MHIHGILHIHIYIYNEKLTIAISSQDKSVIECIALHHRIDGNTIQYNTIQYCTIFRYSLLLMLLLLHLPILCIYQ